jgi:hypothetical protein
MEDASLVVLLLEREERTRQETETKAAKLREEAKAEKAELRQEMREEMQQQVDKVREEMTPTEAISERQLATLQARIEALHAAKLMNDDEV